MELFHFQKSTPTATTLSNLFRFVQFFIAMVLFSWIFIRLPFAFETSGHFFRQFAASPLFVFLLCNAIIVTLFVKSERFSGEIPSADNAETLLSQEIVEHYKYTSPKQFPPEDCSAPANATSGEIEIAIEFQDKEMNSQPNSVGEVGDIVVMEIKSESDESESDDSRVYRRLKLEREVKETVTLGRSETEKFSNGGVLFSGDELSDEEFQRTVDDFIAEHLRFRRQESLQPQLIFQN